MLDAPLCSNVPAEQAHLLKSPCLSAPDAQAGSNRLEYGQAL